MDFTNLTTWDVASAAFDEVRSVVASQPRGSVLSLTDVAGSTLTPQLIEALKDLAVHNRPYVKAAGRA